MDQPSYSMRLLRPFVQLIREDARFPEAVLAELERLDADERIPISIAHGLLRDLVAATGDEAIGLRAGAQLALTDMGVLGYAMASATHLEEALRVGARHMRLVSDVLDLNLIRRDGRAEVQLSCRMPLPRAAADYVLCGISRTWAQASARSTRHEASVCFLHAAPADLEPYARAFPAQRVQFSAPFLGFSVPEAWLAEPLAMADRGLHAVLCKTAELSLAGLPRVESVTERVRALLITELAGHHCSVARAAKQLRMGPRTLGRRLEAEGTTFSELLDTLRHDLAMRYLCERDLPLPDIAQLIGFRQPSGFYRAFRRWTGMTPSAYRRDRRACTPRDA